LNVDAMATGRSIQITKQIGEYLVASELGRFGLVAATFAGSIPDYDIIATDSAFRSVPVQVKTINGTSWQFDIRRFVDVRLDGQKQVIGQPVPVADNIVCVMLALSREYGKDRFYVLSLKALQELLIAGHQSYLEKHGGVRPARWIDGRRVWAVVISGFLFHFFVSNRKPEERFWGGFLRENGNFPLHLSDIRNVAYLQKWGSEIATAERARDQSR
jgi:hypothetical protein